MAFRRRNFAKNCFLFVLDPTEMYHNCFGNILEKDFFFKNTRNLSFTLLIKKLKFENSHNMKECIVGMYLQVIQVDISREFLISDLRIQLNLRLKKSDTNKIFE